MFGLPRLYLLTALSIACTLFGFAGGWKVQGWRQAALEHTRQVQQQRDTQKRLDRVAEAATSHEDFKAKEDIRYVERIKVVQKIVERPVYRNTCFDDDGMRELNAAIRGEDSGKPQTTVSATAKP